MDLKESGLLAEDAASHWYYRSKAEVVRSVLSGMRLQRVLDVGAGSGFFARDLLSTGVVRSAVCVDIGYAEDRDESFAGRPLSFRRSIESDEADLVLMMDVLEHVDDDVGLLASYTARVPWRAHFLLTVPAHRWLWSGHDDFLGHRRRYDIAQLEATVKGAGLQVLHSSYGFGLVLPIAAVTRLVQRFGRPRDAAPASQLVRHGRLVDGLLGALCTAERPLQRYNRLAGLSIFCLAGRVA